MTSAEWIRIITLVLAFPNVGFVWGFAYHLWREGNDPVYRSVFRWATVFYFGAGVVIAGVSWRQIDLFQTPMAPGTAVLLVGEVFITVGMVGQFRQLPRRTW